MAWWKRLLPSRRRLRALAPLAVAAVVAVAVASPSLLRREIDGLDEAQNLMGGLFFVDVMADLPLANLRDYGFEYYSQYPALGFAFWPPFFHLVEGLFFAVFGFDLIVGRICLLSFSVLFAVTMCLAARPNAGRWLAVLAVALALTTPELAKLQNTMLLEIPTLAMAFLAVVLYRRVVARGHWNGWREVVLIAVISAAAIHTKQTILFIFPAMLLDLGFNRRDLLKSRYTWGYAVLFVLLCVPLALFTLKYGAANLAQSFGNLGNIFIADHKVATRWSISGWTYYAGQLFVVINPTIVVLAAVSLLYGVFHRPFLRANALWIAWIACWYLLFSWFDNKQPRFVSFVAPAVVILAVSFAAAIAAHSWRLRTAAIGGFALLLAFQAVPLAQQRYEGYDGVAPIVQRLLADGRGNIAYFGNFRQLFVPYVRHLDPDREVYVLQGDDITGVSGGRVATACHDYIVRWVVLDRPPHGALSGPEIQEQLDGEPCFQCRRQETFGKRGYRVSVFIYEYNGPVADQMKTIPLQSEKLNIHVR